MRRRSFWIITLHDCAAVADLAEPFMVEAFRCF
jgi:hypothetical protein